MSEDTTQRAHSLVEELRAEVDFEIDDVVTNIIRNLPEEYFRSLSHEDQLTHLKALLAISICNLKHELTMHSEDGRHIAVVARKNYPGLLANIISRLPDEQPLIGAKIFTSKTHDFIIDLFEFKSSNEENFRAIPSKLEIEDTVAEVARLTGKPIAAVTEFVSFYHPGSHVLEIPEEVHEHFLAFLEARQSSDVAVRWADQPDAKLAKVTVSAGKIMAKELFWKTAQFLANHSADIEQAFLNDFHLDNENHVAVSSFLISGQFDISHQDALQQLTDYLRKN